MLTRRRNLFLPIAVCAFLCIRGSTSTSDATNTTLRLPTAILPTRYYLHITSRIHEDIFDYNGNVTIELMINKPVDEIVLHAKSLWGFRVTLTDIRNAHQYERLDYTHDIPTQFLRIFSAIQPLNLQVGERYRLEILYNGHLRGEHFGFYRTVYKDQNNNTIPLAITQFEPTSARMAFPCFDEPTFKSKFIVTITHGSNYTALSNMPTDGESIPSLDGEMTTTSFIETPLMPTYLVAFAISNYNHISEFVNGVQHRVFYPPNSKNNGYQALKNAIKSLTALENYLGIKYALPKLDHIRVEKTYGSAMENWGLIVYDQRKFISNVEGIDKHATLKPVILQNHEIAHQWFGNLVSPKWWTYTWLNEGFATYFSYIAAELVYPDWRVPEFFIHAEVETAYNWPINRAMTHHVEKEADIKSSFDVVSYQKGACFVKMFHHAIGHKTFIKGVALYLTTFQYSVADERDLFRALQTAINEDGVELFQAEQAVGDVMHTWTHNHGVPVVTVIRNYQDGTITLRQRSTSKHREETWWIPLNFASASNPNFNVTVADYIMPPQQEVTINLKDINIDLSENDWLIVNKQQTGLMHVVYDDRNLELIAEALSTDHEKIHMLNRALLFRDIAAVIDKDLGAIEPLLEILQYLQFEQELLPWNTAADLILDLGANLSGTMAGDMFKAFMRDIVAPLYRKLYNIPRSGLGVIDLSARAKIIEVACEVDLTECLNHTKTLAQQYLFQGVEIDSDLRDITLCQGIKYFSAEEFQQLVEKLVTSKLRTEFYDDIIYSIRCIRSPQNLKYFLELTFNQNSTYNIMDEFESMQYLAFVYVSNYNSRPVVLEFMGENYKTLCKKSNIVTGTLDRISNYVSEEDGQKEEFLSLLNHVNEVLHDTAKIEDHKIGSRIRKRDHFRRKYNEHIYAWLRNRQRERLARSASTQRRPAFTAARYIVAAGFISNLIGFV